MSSKMYGACDAIMLVPEIIDNGALLVLSLNSNSLGVDGCKALVKGLIGNSVIKELNVAGSNLTDDGEYMSGVLAFANAIPGMEALSSLNISSNKLVPYTLPKGWNTQDGQYFSRIGLIADAPPEGSIADLSGVIALADAIHNMGAMTKLDISSNNLYAAGCKALTEGLSGNKNMVELGLAGNELGNNGIASSYQIGGSYSCTPDLSGVIALADVIPGMQVLDLSSNALGNNGIKLLCAAIRCGLYYAANAVLQASTSHQPTCTC
jgi:hypothetical protein